MNWLAILLFSLSFQPSSAREPADNYPKGYFRSPLDTALYLSANFGAVRANHFHSGIDFKTFGKEGLRVVAAADGYVTRIKVSPFGYGKALYINHPNGYTTVYGHLQKFSPELDSFVRAEQYKQKSFAVELFPPANLFKFKQGDLIALSGNSGGSTGPHLHFEIRDTRTEEIIDPLLFGLPVTDNYKPRLSKSFLIYEMDEDFKHQKGFYPYAEIKQKVLDKWGDTIKVHPGQYTFAAWGEDYINDANDAVHLNYVDVLEDSEPMFSMALQRFAFDDSRQVNCHVDYCQYKEGRKWHKCFADDGNTLGFYTNRDRKVAYVQQGQTRSISIVASDLAGFTDSINFILLGDSTQEKFMAKSRNFKPKETFAYPGKSFTHTDKNYTFTIPKGALYDTIAVNTKYTPAKTKTLNAGYVTIMDADIPLDKAFTVSIKPTVTKGMNTDKLVVVRLTGRNLGYKISEGGTYKNGYVTATSKTFGVFSVAYDNDKPVISRFRQRGNVVAANITDGLSGIDKYNAYIDGEWFLMEYDAKDDLLWGELPAELSAGQHELKIIVSDEKGNTNTFVQKIDK